MAYIKILIQANEHQQEELISIMDDFNVNGFEQKENELIAYFNEKDFDEKEIMHLLEGYPAVISRVEEKNWNEEWEQNFAPVVVGNFCAIRAHFHETITHVEHEIIITPKMSFGTGHHATTYMMIEQMKNLDFKNKTVFDFGTGTGVLAILAEKLGAASVTAIDIEEWSVENAKENMERNNCNNIHLSLSTQIPQQQFNIILANINRNVLLQYLPQLKTSLQPNGFILMSGIILEDEKDLIAASEAEGLTLIKKLTSKNWLSLLFAQH